MTIDSREAESNVQRVPPEEHAGGKKKWNQQHAMQPQMPAFPGPKTGKRY